MNWQTHICLHIGERHLFQIQKIWISSKKLERQTLVPQSSLRSENQSSNVQSTIFCCCFWVRSLGSVWKNWAVLAQHSNSTQVWTHSKDLRSFSANVMEWSWNNQGTDLIEEATQFMSRGQVLFLLTEIHSGYRGECRSGDDEILFSKWPIRSLCPCTVLFLYWIRSNVYRRCPRNTRN